MSTRNLDRQLLSVVVTMRSIQPPVACRVLFLAIGISAPAYAQFFGLATPADGTRVYFTTPSRQKDTAQSPYGKLFQYGPTGLQLTLARDPTAGGAYDLWASDASADGSVLAIGGIRHCLGTDAVLCSKQELFTTTVNVSGQAQDFPGMLKVSANGKWAFGGGSQSNVGFYYQLGYRVNLTTGEVRPITLTDLKGPDFMYVASAGRPVANDGTAVFTTYNPGVYVLQGSQLAVIPAPGISSDPVIDAAARTIVFASGPPCGALSCTLQPSELRITSPGASGTDLLVSSGYSPSLTDDGRQVLYLSDRSGAPQAYLINADGSGDRRLTNDPDGMARTILSGDGTTAYAVTLGGRLIRITVGPATVAELIPASPFIGVPPPTIPPYPAPLPVLAPNKLVTFPGAGFSAAATTATAPLPASLGGVRVTIQGLAAGILNVQPTSVTIVVPPGVTASQAAVVQVDVSGPTPFEGATTAVITGFAPEFLLGPPALYYPNSLLAAHQDWSGLVSAQSPARPGEALHAYAIGLGQTSPAVPYGEAGPGQEPFARLASPLVCTDGRSTAPVGILFAGLAPGFVGVYQVDWQVPSGAAAGDFLLSCATGDHSSTFGGYVTVGGG